jgi:hypothetical protein
MWRLCSYQGGIISGVAAFGSYKFYQVYTGSHSDRNDNVISMFENLKCELIPPLPSVLKYPQLYLRGKTRLLTP